MSQNTNSESNILDFVQIGKRIREIRSYWPNHPNGEIFYKENIYPLKGTQIISDATAARAMSDIENGSFPQWLCNADALCRLADVLHVSLDYLLLGKQEEPPTLRDITSLLFAMYKPFNMHIAISDDLLTITIPRFADCPHTELLASALYGCQCLHDSEKFSDPVAHAQALDRLIKTTPPHTLAFMREKMEHHLEEQQKKKQFQDLLRQIRTELTPYADQ